MSYKHFLDLPNISGKPRDKELFDTLDKLRLPKLRNFEQNIVDDIPGLFGWLTRVVGSELDWVVSEEKRDEIWHLASQCLSERCGRTAEPTRIREMDIFGKLEDQIMKVDVIEPALTADSLGLKTWGSSYVLANRLYRSHDKMFPEAKDKPILELGSGTGLCGILLGKLGYKVVITDLPEIVENASANIDLNHVCDMVIATTLDWTEPEKYAFNGDRYQYIIVSDPIYSPDHPSMVVNVIRHYQDKNSIICVQLPLRAKYEQERQKFYDLMHKNSMVQIDYEEEDGRDDWGASKYAWSLWRPSPDEV